MSDREKLIELLGANVCKYEACVGCEHQDNLGTCVDYQKTNLADYLISNGVTVQEWIPVSVRLPTFEDAVKFSVLAVFKFDDRPRIWRIDVIRRNPEKFTHWMPLPELPKECE